MTIFEFFSELSTSNQKILSGINANLMGSIWTSGQTGFQSILDGMSQDIYLYNADKDLNPIVEKWLTFNNITDISNISATNYALLIKFLFGKYQDKWIKLYNYVYAQTYNPIWNVEGEESTIHTFEHGKTTTETKDFTIEHGRDSTDTETVTDNITENDVYGFNSSSPAGASKSTNNGERTTEYTGSDTDTHSGTDTFVNSGVDTERTTYTRGGNIGVTSTQNMLEQEIELRRKFNYFEIVMKDVIRELAVNIY